MPKQEVIKPTLENHPGKGWRGRVEYGGDDVKFVTARGTYHGDDKDSAQRQLAQLVQNTKESIEAQGNNATIEATQIIEAGKDSNDDDRAELKTP